MKRALIIFAAITLIFLLAVAPLVFAEEPETTKQVTNSDSIRSKFKTDLETLKTDRKAFIESKKVERTEILKTKTISFAEKQINVRLKVLTEHERRLSSSQCSKITSTDVKTPVTAAITAMRADLNAALVKIKAATTAEAATAELKTAIEKTRVFMYLNPAISGLCRAGKLMDKIVDRFDPLIIKLKAKDIDTTNLEKELTDAKASINAAIVTYGKILATPASTDNKTLLTTAKTQLKAAKTSLSNFKTELAKIASDLKTDNNLRSTPENDGSGSSSSAPDQNN